jgi:hypothetical protein
LVATFAAGFVVPIPDRDFDKGCDQGCGEVFGSPGSRDRLKLSEGVIVMESAPGDYAVPIQSRAK